MRSGRVKPISRILDTGCFLTVAHLAATDGPIKSLLPFLDIGSFKTSPTTAVASTPRQTIAFRAKKAPTNLHPPHCHTPLRWSSCPLSSSSSHRKVRARVCSANLPTFPVWISLHICSYMQTLRSGAARRRGRGRVQRLRSQAREGERESRRNAGSYRAAVQ